MLICKIWVKWVVNIQVYMSVANLAGGSSVMVVLFLKALAASQQRFTRGGSAPSSLLVLYPLRVCQYKRLTQGLTSYPLCTIVDVGEYRN